MIIFHEGMPRNGKSYAAFVDHILPALKAGRKVYARLDGLNYPQIADLAEITEERCRELLIHLEVDDIPRLDQLALDNDSLLVVDELQNYFPAQRQPLSKGMTTFVAEHGHHGLDILTMGQVLKDCHKTWMNRTNRKIQFVKKDMLGKPNEYKWTMYTGSLDTRGNVKFTEVSKGDGTYDDKYFGCYKSHSDGTDNKGTYSDERANVFKSPVFRKWLPLLGIMVLASVGYLVYLFNGGLAKEVNKEAKAKPVSVTVTETKEIDGHAVTKTYVEGQPAAKVAQAAPEPAKASSTTDPFEMPDLVTDLNKDNRMRLGGIIRTAKHTRVLIEWRDSSQRIIERMTDEDLAVLGYQVATTNSNSVAILIRADKRYLATAWPLEDFKGTVPEDAQNRIHNADGRSFTGGQPPAPEGVEADPIRPARYRVEG